MPRKRIRDRPPSLALSFVDTVSGGFGAAFFLFLIFASLPIESEARKSGGGQRFLEIWMFWPDNAGVAELYLTHNDNRPIRFTSSLLQEDPATGRLKTDSVVHPFWREGFASGFSWFGEAHMSAAAAPADGATEMRATRFRLGDHCPGNLRISATVFGRRSAADWLTGGPLPPVPVKIELIVSPGHGAKEIYEGEAQVTSGSIETPIELKRDAKADFNVKLHEATGEQAWCEKR
ncbi:hypothetical protein C0V73_07240 [Rhizobium sp. TH135]|uniref:hypothetical protein n=1 Tax=Rhizobium sp. TH135 TaxID=2067451 RepID=UPI000C7E25E3|nr:hypothetical protein [Rhizobium sp. TH135]PLK71886.1 hypothetical protein C0V73_07240 [Rhizobium sp. TH135]